MAGSIEMKKALCNLCVGACSVEVHVKDGEIVKITGDLGPGGKEGFRCARNRLAALDFHNHSRRLDYPLKRAGARGEGKWQRISWRQAMDEIAGKLARIRDEYGPEAVFCWAGTGSTLYHWAEQRWCNLFGTPNRFVATMNCFAPQCIVEAAMYGSDTVFQLPQPGVTKCMVVFSANPFESRPFWWDLIMRGKREGAKLIVIEPRLTSIAKRADLWLQLRPGTDAALAYGMLNVVIQEGLYDKEFVRKWCLGFEEISSLAREYTPEVVEGITWVPRDKIVEAARTYATSKPALIQTAWGVAHSHLGRGVLQTNLAKFALGAITGNLDVEGGARLHGDMEGLDYDLNLHYDELINHPLRKRDNLSAERFPAGSVRALALFRETLKKTYRQGYPRDLSLSPNVSPAYLWRAILEEKPHPVKALLSAGSTILCTRTNTRRIHQALRSDNLELSVALDLFMGPKEMLADYVLPAADWLETPAMYFSSYNAGERSVAPLYERRCDYDFWRELGNRLGQQGYWPDTVEDMYSRFLKPTGLSFPEFVSRTRHGRDAGLIPPRRYRKYEQKGFATPSGKVELVPGLLKTLGYKLLDAYQEPVRSPVSTPELAGSYPLILITGGRTRVFAHAMLREEKKLRELHPDPIMQIHPDTAGKYGISDGAWVYIETPEGRIRQKAELTAGIDPRVVHIQHGWWFPEQPGQEPHLFGLWEVNAGAILPDDPDMCDFQGGSPLTALLCRVSKAQI